MVLPILSVTAADSGKIDRNGGRIATVVKANPDGPVSIVNSNVESGRLHIGVLNRDIAQGIWVSMEAAYIGTNGRVIGCDALAATDPARPLAGPTNAFWMWVYMQPGETLGLYSPAYPANTSLIYWRMYWWINETNNGWYSPNWELGAEV